MIDLVGLPPARLDALRSGVIAALDAGVFYHGEFVRFVARLVEPPGGVDRRQLELEIYAMRQQVERERE